MQLSGGTPFKRRDSPASRFQRSNILKRTGTHGGWRPGGIMFQLAARPSYSRPADLIVSDAPTQSFC
jgi:hypothetical protein